MSLFRRRPSPAMLVALLALVLAMTGTAAAAVLVSAPDQLADSVVTGPKVATDAITSRALNEPSVTTANLSDRSVTAAKLATGGVDGRALSFNSVNSSHLADRQVGSDDLVNPVYSAAVSADGTTSAARSVGVDPAQTGKVGGLLTGLYTVGFRQDMRDCTVTATSVGRKGIVATVNQPSSLSPRTATIALSEPRLSGSAIVATGVDAPFNVIAQC